MAKCIINSINVLKINQIYLGSNSKWNIDNQRSYGNKYILEILTKFIGKSRVDNQGSGGKKYPNICEF